jgi:hypothetical protein
MALVVLHSTVNAVLLQQSLLEQSMLDQSYH